MVKAEAIVNKEKSGCNVSISIEGHGEDLINETLALIQGVMGSLKEQSVTLHMIALNSIAKNTDILFGGEDDMAKVFERFVATAKFREGVN